MAGDNNQANIKNIFFNFFSTCPGFSLFVQGSLFFHYLIALSMMCICRPALGEVDTVAFDWFQFFHAMNENISLFALVAFLLPDGCPDKDEVTCRLDGFSTPIETTCSRVGMQNLTPSDFGQCIPVYDESCEGSIMRGRLGMAILAIVTDWILFFAKILSERKKLSKNHRDMLGVVALICCAASSVSAFLVGFYVGDGTLKGAELLVTSGIFASSVTSRLGIDAISDEVARVTQ